MIYVNLIFNRKNKIFQGSFKMSSHSKIPDQSIKKTNKPKYIFSKHNHQHELIHKLSSLRFVH